jgi:hypothetical protein
LVDSQDARGPRAERPSRPEAAVQAWREFWFRPEAIYPLGLVRIAFGALTVAWTLSLLPGLDAFFGADGVVSHSPSLDNRWDVFDVLPGDQVLLTGWIVLLLAAIAMTVGWHSRIASLLVLVLVFSFLRRDPWVFNAGDILIRIEALLLAVAPTGAALSLDCRRRTGSFWSAETRAPWAIRLLQVQLSLIYLATVVNKAQGETWPRGTSVSFALRLEDMLILPIPQWISTNAFLMNTATWGTVAIELAIGILVWNRRCRPWVLAAGVAMHIGILLTLAVGFFTPAMFVLYLAFIPPETVKRMPDVARRALGRIRRRTAESP